MDHDPTPPPADPWATALERHFAAPSPPPRRQVTLTGASLVLAIIGAVALAAGVAVLATLAVVNYQRADENHARAVGWQDRSEQLQDLVGERTKALNRQTARLNVASNRLRRARVAIDRSEEDVADLQVRQRELAAEKAAVEDERAFLALEREALGDVATKLARCNSVMFDFILASDGGYLTTGHAVRVQQRCSEAQAAVDGYSSTVGAP